MAQEPVVIPDKIYFKIGEVCEIVGVQTHVLRYWETEFSVLSPQKNKSGQRSYRRRDVEIALRIKQLLYNEMFTIAGANKKLQQEAREGSKSKSVAKAAAVGVPPAAPKAVKPPSETLIYGTDPQAPMLFDAGFERPALETPEAPEPVSIDTSVEYKPEQRDALKVVAGHLIELREMLRNSSIA